jgi:hypothetical protein
MTQPLDGVAIRFAPLGKELVGDRLGDRHPVVCFVQQGLDGARLPAAAESQAPTPLAPSNYLHQIERVIFIIDRSGSMKEKLHIATDQRKSDYIRDRISECTPRFFQPDTKISLIQFDHQSQHIDCGSGVSALARTKSTLRMEWGGGETDFREPLLTALSIIQEDRRIAFRERPEAAENGIRSLVFLLTDGEESTPKEHSPILKDIRDANALTFICGIGEDYNMARVLEMASAAGWAGWSHEPTQSGAEDVFKVKLPTLLHELATQKHYVKIVASGDYRKLTAISPAFHDVPRGEPIYAGHSGTSAGLMFQESLRTDLFLEAQAGRHVGDKSPFTMGIPILDAEAAAGPHFEQWQQGEKLLQQFAILRALRKREIGPLKEILSRDKSLEPLLGPAIWDLKHRRSGGSQSVYGAMSINGDSLLQLSNWAIETENDDRGMTARPRLVSPPGQAPDLDSVDLSPFDAPAQPRSPRTPANPSPEENCSLTPIRTLHPILKLSPGITAVIGGERHTDSIPLHDLLQNKEYVFGRERSKADPPDTIRVILTGEGADTISRDHFKISLHDGRIFIEDLKSRNGTFLGRTKLPARVPSELVDEATITLNTTTRFVFSASSGPLSEPT